MEKVSCLPLGSLISGVADCFVVELENKDTKEKQKTVILANFIAERTE